MQPDFKDLAFKGKMILLDLKEAEAAEHNSRIAAVSAAQVVTRADTAACLPRPSSLEARLASAKRVPPSQGMLQDEAYCAALGQTFRSARGTPTRVARQSQGEIDEMWTDVIAEQNLAARHATRPTSQADSNHGWGSIVEKVQAEQPHFEASGATSEADRMWTEIIRGMNAKITASA